MQLIEHLKIRTPLVWVVTDESPRAIDVVTTHGDRPTFRVDALEGVVRWNPKQQRWLKVLFDVETPDGVQKEPSFSPNDAIKEAMRTSGIVIIDHAHLTAENLVSFFTAVQSVFRTAFLTDDSDRVPAQFILLSCKTDMPPEIMRHAAKVDLPLPKKEDLVEMLRIVDESSAEISVSDEAKTLVARAALGMSESEFIQAVLRSMNTLGEIDHDFVNKAKLDKLKAEGLLTVRNPSLTLDQIGGLDNAKKLIQLVVRIWGDPEKARAKKVKPLRRVLMIGVPGTGKSAICEATARSLGLELAQGGVSNAMSKWVGESEQNMRRIFNQVRAMAPVVFWIDELGRDLSGSGSQGDSGTTDRVHGEFLTGLQDLPDDVFLMAAANRIDGLPPEMLRADRFDKIMFVGFPTLTEREDIFRIHLGEGHEAFDIAKLAEMTPQFAGAEIKALVEEVRFNVFEQSDREITTADLEKHIPRVKGRVWVNHRGPIVEMYKRATVEWDWASSAQEEEAGELLSNATKPFDVGMAPLKKAAPPPPPPKKRDEGYVPRFGSATDK